MGAAFCWFSGHAKAKITGSHFPYLERQKEAVDETIEYLCFLRQKKTKTKQKSVF